MLTRAYDRGLEAMHERRRKLPDLAEIFPAGSPQREAIDKAVAAVEDARRVVFEQPHPHR